VITNQKRCRNVAETLQKREEPKHGMQTSVDAVITPAYKQEIHEHTSHIMLQSTTMRFWQAIQNHCWGYWNRSQIESPHCSLLVGGLMDLLFA
jgi:hypothetical protein